MSGAAAGLSGRHVVARRISAIATASAGITGAAVIRQGAFFAPDVLALPSVILVLAIAAGQPTPGGSARRAVIGVGCLAAWWLIAAVGWGNLPRAAPLLGSLVAFGSALSIGSRLDSDRRRAAQAVLVVGGTAFVGVGLVGLAWRLSPLAMPAQGLWRLSGTLTYANAAGLLLAMLAILAVGLEGPPWCSRVASYVLLCGLAATQSRGAALALTAGALCLPRRTLREAAWPALLAAGTAVPMLAVAYDPQPQPAILITVAAGVAIASRSAPGRVLTTILLPAGALAALMLAAHVSGLTTALVRRLSAHGIDDRAGEWHAAWAAISAHPILGNGPERALTLVGGGVLATAQFAHNEYLQITAGGGVVGLALLCWVVAALARGARRTTPLQRAANGALVACAVGGLTDFSWHLPAIGLVAGWTAALTTQGEP